MIRYQFRIEGEPLRAVAFYSLRDACEFIATIARDLMIDGHGCIVRFEEGSRLPMLVGLGGRALCAPVLLGDESAPLGAEEQRCNG